MRGELGKGSSVEPLYLRVGGLILWNVLKCRGDLISRIEEFHCIQRCPHFRVLE